MENKIQPRMVKLAQQARSLLEKEKLYTDPLMNRRKLANQLNTNEKYLADAIRVCEGLRVNDFINSFRVQHACSLLVEHQQMPILSVALDSGINSATTLFRLFHKYYGMSPTGFRKNKSEHNHVNNKPDLLTTFSSEKSADG